MKKTKVHVQYTHIIHQLMLEDEHGQVNTGHEALRHCTYTQMVLDHLGKELDFYRGPLVRFCSKVLTPILQRQLKGVPNVYAPSIWRAIALQNDMPTISQVTKFYLGNNPLSPGCIPSVRTMVFTPDFSLLFCLTHFTFVNFSYPYDTNLFSYLPFISSYAFTLTDHTRRRSKAVNWIQRVVVQRRKQHYYHLMMKGGPFTSLRSSPRAIQNPSSS